MSFMKADVKSFGAKLKARIREKAEDDICKKRAEAVLKIGELLIMRSPIYTSTYIHAHTIEINGVSIREPVIYWFPISKQEMSFMYTEEALVDFKNREYEAALNTPVTKSISIIMPDVVYWGIEHVEPNYHVYDNAARAIDIMIWE